MNMLCKGWKFLAIFRIKHKPPKISPPKGSHWIWPARGGHSGKVGLSQSFSEDCAKNGNFWTSEDKYFRTSQTYDTPIKSCLIGPPRHHTPQACAWNDCSLFSCLSWLWNLVHKMPFRWCKCIHYKPPLGFSIIHWFKCNTFAFCLKRTYPGSRKIFQRREKWMHTPTSWNIWHLPQSPINLSWTAWHFLKQDPTSQRTFVPTWKTIKGQLIECKTFPCLTGEAKTK